jgi:hypothetical protein
MSHAEFDNRIVEERKRANHRVTPETERFKDESIRLSAMREPLMDTVNKIAYEYLYRNGHVLMHN